MPDEDERGRTKTGSGSGCAFNRWAADEMLREKGTAANPCFTSASMNNNL